MNAPMRMCERYAIVGSIRGRGRSKKHRGEVIRHDMKHLQLIEDIILDMRVCRSKIRVEG